MGQKPESSSPRPVSWRDLIRGAAIRLPKYGPDLNDGPRRDRETLRSDWQHVMTDLDAAVEKHHGDGHPFDPPPCCETVRAGMMFYKLAGWHRCWPYWACPDWLREKYVPHARAQCPEIE